MRPVVFLFILIFASISCTSLKNKGHSLSYESADLSIEQVSDHVYRHVSYLNTEDFGKVECNGMIVVYEKEALVFDTPTTDSVSRVLIQWINRALESEIVAVVPTHFHDDCLGGLAEFHAAHIPSYASHKTIEAARAHHVEVPEKGVGEFLSMKVGDQQVFLDYFGEGHTSDNVVGYVPAEKVLFGGCLIKELGASEGNLEDANVLEWANTVRQIKQKYTDIQRVIPGHGEPGDVALLEYTIDLFSQSTGNQGSN